MAPKKGRGKNASKPQTTVPDADHIVFSNKPDGKKPKNEKDTAPAIPRPDTRKIIGGASWTGKLPVNLLSEHCQREKWNKPDYSMRQMPSANGAGPLYRSSVTLSKTDPKTRESTTIPSFQLPSSHVHLADQPSALEARHFAATYALFRVSSMKQIHMSLPPQYRDLWKGPFQEIKKADVDDQKAWRYDADPFAAEAKRKEIIASIEKRQQGQTKQETNKGPVSLSLDGTQTSSSRTSGKGPRVELGVRLRAQLETLARKNIAWNPNNLLVSDSEAAKIVSSLTQSGFRQSHTKEALKYCGSRQEVLEWLLIHVPEDDLPKWSLPQGYSAGVSLASSDLVRETKLNKLAKAGYPSHMCIKALQENNGDECKALEVLQAYLVPAPAAVDEVNMGDNDTWQDETMALEAIFDERFSLESSRECTILARTDMKGDILLRFYKPHRGYPCNAVPIITVESDSIPAYIRLSATRQAVSYAWESLRGDQMLYALIEWLESSLPTIFENPGSLLDVDINSSTLKFDATQPSEQPQARMENNLDRRLPLRQQATDSRSGAELKDAWQRRQMMPEQIEMNSVRKALPASFKEADIIRAVSQKQVTLITGDTGSGKSTQSVQFLLDDAVKNSRGPAFNLVCTQPRRVAALSLSDRVSAERCSIEGQEVGYVIRGDSKVSFKTKITFMTTGVLLRRLQSASNLATALTGISHVVVDEVHERSLDTDFLLALLKDAMKDIPKIKIILMSATVNADLFADYFGGDRNVSRVHIEGRTFPVQDLFLDDVLKIVGNKISEDVDEAESENDFNIAKEIRGLGAGINYQLIARLVQQIDQTLGNNTGGILIFLPGTMEIDRCLNTIGNIPNILGFPLHASLLPAEQKRVFPPAPRGKRKVIAATNVAETSITIEDIVAVVDTGRVKETNYDAISNIVRLQEVWASQAACKQRRGRAGRVRAGTCYKLFTRNVEDSMRPHAEPEIRRVQLEQLCLTVKATASGSDVEAFLSRTISPPERGAVENALRNLHRMGALDKNCLTGLGSFMSLIPADLRCVKLLIYGSIFSCVEAGLTLAAILAEKSPFVSPRDKREEAKEARASFPIVDGDVLLDRAAFDEWKSLSTISSPRTMFSWCSTKFLSNHTLRNIDSTRRQFLDSLKETALIPSTYSSASETSHQGYNENGNNHFLLRALLAGSLNPQIAEIKLPDKKFIASMTGAKELDPEARTIKYFNEENGRVFVHPSSILFDAQGYSGNAAYLSYFSKMATTKTFIRDLTPLNAYSLLLFGGEIEVDTTGAGIVVDGWIKMRGWARIGVLVSRLRAILDDELKKRIDNPGFENGDRELYNIVRRLIELNGQDQ